MIKKRENQHLVRFLEVVKHVESKKSINKFLMTLAIRLFYSFMLVISISFTSVGAEKLPIPRFVTIKLSEVNARSGPSIASPIEWVFVRKHEPVEIISEYDQWRKIRDIKGEGGWVHSSVLSGKKFVIITANDFTYLFKSASQESRIIAKLNSEVRCQLHKCIEDWCNIRCQSLDGWVIKKSLWGVYAK